MREQPTLHIHSQPRAAARVKHPGVTQQGGAIIAAMKQQVTIAHHFERMRTACRGANDSFTALQEQPTTATKAAAGAGRQCPCTLMLCNYGIL